MPLDSLEDHIYFLLCYIGAQCYIMDKKLSGPDCPDQSSCSANYCVTWESYINSQCVGVFIRTMGLECYCEDEIKLMHNEQLKSTWIVVSSQSKVTIW